MFSPESLRIVSVAAFIVLFAIGIAKRPVFASIGYMVLVYCKLSFYYPIFSTIKSELLFAVIILFRLLIIKKNIRKLTFAYNPLNKYLLIFIFFVFVSYYVAWDRQYSWDHAVYHFLKVLILYLMIVMSVDNTQDLKIFIWAFVIMFAYLAYEPIYYFLTKTGGQQYTYGVNYIAEIGILSGHVALANNMNQMIPIALFLFLSTKEKKKKILSAIPVIIFLIALIGSGSRGGFAGFILFCVVLIWFSENRKKYGVYVIAGLIILIMFSASFMYTASRINKGSIRGRLVGLTHGFGMIQKGNIIGVGPGCYRFARGRYFGYTMEAHNIYGEVMGSLGIPGTIAWFFFIRQIFLNLIHARKKLKKLSQKENPLSKILLGVQISIIVRLMISMASHGLFYFYWYVIAAISVAAVKIVDNIELDCSSEIKTSKQQIA